MCSRKLALVQEYPRDRRIFRIGRLWKTIWYKISRIDSSITSYFWIFFIIYHYSMCGHTLSGIPEIFDKPRFDISSTIHDVRRYDKSIREILYHILFLLSMNSSRSRPRVSTRFEVRRGKFRQVTHAKGTRSPWFATIFHEDFTLFDLMMADW